MARMGATMSETHHEEPELTPAERRLLEAVPDRDPDPEAAPIDDGRLMALRRGELSDDAAAALAGRLAADPDARALLIAQAEAARGSEAMSVPRVLARHRSGWRRPIAVGVAVVAALAAAVILFVGRPAPLPEYTADGPFGGVADTRGAEDGPTRVFVPGNTLTLYARPAAPLDAPVECVAVVDDGAYLAQAVDARYVTLAPNGVCRLEAPVEAILPHFAGYTVALVLLPRGSPERSGSHGIPRREDGKWLVEKIEYRSVEQP